MKTKQVHFRSYDYARIEKKQIYLHHTAGGPSGEQVFQFWASDDKKVATCVAISNDGSIVQGFPSECWAYHLGLGTSVFLKHGLPYIPLDRSSIGIEICNYGPLTQKGGKYYNYVGGEIKKEDVTTLDKPYKGYKYWQNYTDAQIESVRELLIHWNTKYGIDLKYNEDIWDVTKRALKGDGGVYTHNSVRADKADVYPHPKLIAMLKSLTKEK